MEIDDPEMSDAFASGEDQDSNPSFDDSQSGWDGMDSSQDQYDWSAPTYSRTVCPVCGGSGQQYIPNLYYDAYMGWQGGYVACSGCGGSGYIG